MRKPAPAREMPSTTQWERMDNAVRAMFSVSKADLLKEEAKHKRKRGKKRATQRQG